MSYTYAQKRQAAARTAQTEVQEKAGDSAVPNSVRLAALEAGKASPTAAEMGRRVDLPEAMRARMEASFGADLSAVRLYESQTVGDAGAEAITQGSSIAFAPGKLDLSSRSGQELLGHELSHVVSQQRGEVKGGGFLANASLEARADREGARAAAGEQVYGGAVAPLSGASAAPAAGPMQAKREKGEEAPKSAGLGRHPELIHEAPKRWGLRSRFNNWRSLKAKTGLSQKKNDVLSRMDQDMYMTTDEYKDEDED